MAISPVPPFSGTPPSRSQPQATFNTNVANWVSYTTTIQTDLNTFATQANALAVEVDGYATDAAQSLVDTQAAYEATLVAKSAAESVSNYKGQWSSLSGSLNKPATVTHNGAFWALNNNLANVATSEPSLTNADWQFVSGTRWQDVMTTSGILPKNALCQILATSAPVDRQLLAGMSIGDFIVIANSDQSTEAVRVINNGYTIRGNKQVITPADNITLLSGDTLSLRCTAANQLEVYQ